MSESSTPKTWWEAWSSHVVWGALVFTCFLVFVEKLVEEHFGQALAAFLLGLGIMAVALHSKTWLEKTNPNWAFAAALALVIALVLSPFVEQKQWPLSAWFSSSSVAKSPTADEIAAAVVRALPPRVPSSGEMLNAPNMPAPKPQRSKQAINELLDESGKILDIVKKNIPILEEWRKLLNQNPESVCLGSDQEALKGQIKSLTDKIRESGEEVGNVLEQNSIDRAELTLLLRNTRMPMLFGFAAATNTLFAYRGDISRIEGHPSCDAIVRANQIPTAYANMLTGFLQFSSWLGETQEKLSNYRDDLRKELRNAP